MLDVLVFARVIDQLEDESGLKAARIRLGLRGIVAGVHFFGANPGALLAETG